MKKYGIFLIYLTILICFSLQLWSTSSVTVTFKSLKQYQQLCFKGPPKLRYSIEQKHPRQILLLFDQNVVIKKGQNFPNFITITPFKNSPKQFMIHFGKTYTIAEFQKEGGLYLDLYPEEKSISSQSSFSTQLKDESKVINNDVKESVITDKEVASVLSGTLTIHKSVEEEALVLENTTPFRLASFIQGKFIYILWPPSVIPRQEILPLIPGINKIEWLKKQQKKIGILITIQPYNQLHVYKEKGQWTLGLKKNVQKENYNWTISKDPRGRSFCVIEDVDGEIEDFYDPLTEQLFHIIYSNNSSKKLDFPIEMIDMKIFPSLNGVICQSYHKDVAISCKERNIIFSTPAGLIVSTEEERHRNISSITQNFFKFYTVEKEKQSWTERKNLLISSLNQPTLEQTIQRHFDLIRFFLSTGFAEEAFSFLQKVIQKDPIQQESDTYLGLLAMTQVLREHHREALTILKNARFIEEKEIALWIALIQIALGQNIANHFIFDENIELLKSYPLFIKMKFVFAAASYFLKNQQLEQAKKMLALISKSEFETAIPEELQYLQSLVMYKEGQKEAAVSIWQELSKNFKTRIGVEANLSLLDHEIVSGILTTDAIIKKLKNLRYRWRDDDIELRIIYKLIGCYLKQKQYRSALTEMQYLENNFSAFIDVQEMRQKIQEQLVKIYTNPDQNLPLLNALGLYVDYKNYFPKDARMKAIRLSLAEKLFGIGLIDQGVDILRHQLTESSLEEQVSIGTKISEIYIHNEKPEEALKILQETANNTVSKEMLEHRQLIEAQSLGLIHKYDEALSIIQHRSDKEAMFLKRDLLLTANRWVEAGEILQEFLEKETIDKGPLTTEQSQLILDLAVTAALSKKFPLLNNLRLRYFSLMEKTDLASLFNLITKKPEASKQINESTILQSLEKAEEFTVLLMAYKARLKKNPNY